MFFLIFPFVKERKFIYIPRRREKGKFRMNFKIDPQKSIRSQIVEHFRVEIRKGSLKPGDRLPSARELAKAFGTAEATYS